MKLNYGEVENAARGGIETASTTLEMVHKIQNSGMSSLSEYTATTRLAPIAIIDEGIESLDTELRTALLQTLLSLYTSMYLRAINIAKVGAIEFLDQFSTRDNEDFISQASTFTGTLESLDDDLCELPVTIDGYSGEVKLTEESFDKDAIRDANNMVVGKQTVIEIPHGKETVKIPIQIALAPKLITQAAILQITSTNAVEKTAKGRYHQWRSGEIRFVRDYLLNLDLIEQDRKALINDETGLLMTNRTKRFNSLIELLAKDRVSPNAVSTMQIITSETAEQIETRIRGKLAKSRIREKFFKSNVLMMLVVVDTVTERFTIYYRGIAQASEYTLEDIRGNAKKAGGVDIESMIKAFKMGEAASF